MQIVLNQKEVEQILLDHVSERCGVSLNTCDVKTSYASITSVTLSFVESKASVDEANAKISALLAGASTDLNELVSELAP